MNADSQLNYSLVDWTLVNYSLAYSVEHPFFVDSQLIIY